MKPELSVIIPYEASSREAAALFARELSVRPGTQLIIAGDGELGVAPGPHTVALPDRVGRGEALKAHCDRLLRAAEDKVEKIRLGRDGRPAATEPLDGENGQG